MEKMISYNCEVFFLPSNDIYDEIDDYFSLILEKIKYIASEQWFSQMFWIESWLCPNPIRTYLFVLNLTNNFFNFHDPIQPCISSIGSAPWFIVTDLDICICFYLCRCVPATCGICLQMTVDDFGDGIW